MLLKIKLLKFLNLFNQLHGKVINAVMIFFFLIYFEQEASMLFIELIW